MQFPLKLHGYPFGKTHYASAAEFPLLPAQGHWNPANLPDVEGHMHLGHTHVELWAPYVAEVPHEPFTLKGRIQLFHTTGEVTSFTGNIARDITLEVPGPIIGDKHGVILRNFSLVVDPAMTYWDGNGVEQHTPENGWFHLELTAITTLANGAIQRTVVLAPFYAVGDPSVPETPKTFILFARAGAASPASGSGHGNPRCEIVDSYAPILAPIAAPISCVALSQSYARAEGPFPWPNIPEDRMVQLLDMDLHNNIPGTIVQEFKGDAAQRGFFEVRFDPAWGAGTHKTAIIWDQKTGAGGPGFGPNEEASALLVLPVTIDPNGWKPVTSPDGTTITTSGEWLIDSAGQVWHLMGGRAMSRGYQWGAHVGVALSICRGEIRLQTEDGQWYSAHGTPPGDLGWSPVGNEPCAPLTPPEPPTPVEPPPPASADGIRIKPGDGQQIVNDAAKEIYQLDPSGFVQVAPFATMQFENRGGPATEGTFCGGVFRVLADGRWWIWTDGFHSSVSADTDPCSGRG